MTVGQMENLKYYPEYKRGFELMKERMYDSQEVMNGTGSGMYISRQKHGDAVSKGPACTVLYCTSLSGGPGCTVQYCMPPARSMVTQQASW